MYSNVKVSPASELAVTLEAAKIQLRILNDLQDQDTFIQEAIAQAVDYCEEVTKRSFVTSTWELTIDQVDNAHSEEWWDGVREGHMASMFSPCPIVMPNPPIKEILSIKFYDFNDTEIEFPLSDCVINPSLGRITLKNGKMWPSNLRGYDAVKITYTKGYGNAIDVPSAIKRAILLLVSHWFENREIIQGGENFTAFTIGEAPHMVDAILKKFMVKRI